MSASAYVGGATTIVLEDRGWLSPFGNTDSSFVTVSLTLKVAELSWERGVFDPWRTFKSPDNEDCGRLSLVGLHLMGLPWNKEEGQVPPPGRSTRGSQT